MLPNVPLYVARIDAPPKSAEKLREMPNHPLPLQSPLLLQAGFSHGFFLRTGGVSEGVFSSLNFTTLTGDSRENVERNLSLAGESLGVDGRQIYFLSQVHGTDWVIVDGSEQQDEVLQKQGDIVLTKTTRVAAGIRTADCVPILLACPETGWVAACHSGWQGCVRQAAPATVAALRKAGAGRRLLSAVGPHISRKAFEVSEDVAIQLVDASPDKDIVDRSFAKPHVDLRKMVRSQLVASGLNDEDIDDVEGCTVLDEAHFFSFRRDGNPSGRMLSAIVGRG